MKEKKPFNQMNLFGLDKYINELIYLYNSDKLPNKILLSGQKGTGKSTLAYHFINFVLSKDEEFSYDLNNFEINPKNHSFQTIVNMTNINFFLIDIKVEDKFIDINQIRELILNLTKSSFNNKPRFILIDNIEFLNVNSVNALLKVLEEPSSNVHFILINNNKKVLSTLLSRCINFKISLSHRESLQIVNKLLDSDVDNLINKDLINYYSTPGNIYNLINFSINNDYDLKNINLRQFLERIIKDNHYKKESSFQYLIFDFVEFYLSRIETSVSLNVREKYSYFLKRISDTKKFNLDQESLFIEFKDKILNE